MKRKSSFGIDFISNCSENSRDLRNFKIMNKFDETHSDEVTSLQFFHEKPSILLSGSLDGTVCLFDLSKGDEEEAADTGINCT